MGEIGFYYLSYVEQIIADYPTVRFPCLRRDKSETVRSYIDKIWFPGDRTDRQPTHRNHWVNHNGSQWIHDPIWDKCYPTLKAETLE